MAKIEIEGMHFYAHHGCFKEERVIGTYFTVDCSMDCHITTAAKEDDLNKTINYQTVYQIIAQELKKTSLLLENIAYRIIIAIHNQFPLIDNIEIKIRKLSPPLGGKIEAVSVTLNSDDVKE
ncbi:MAG: dihydroneopterin aldolase [Bacteroidales bacterium]|jgi:dihydroneopterin aldolase|nr:dihydroneopterin aldolase [Bacteroidales bacterium]MDD2687496.1 dihydroneopterin aldolase [Bacteroidales bacterium]MDD3330844.1 dihydroneopterin aldolase [Bacteroidales bacterium]MDD3691328.1 dihydroneopterin aldolase [Bacteroidales bacterium]MDD4044520.1 dihydroneopterin aldolase [Bacteroidales bacterium]